MTSKDAAPPCWHKEIDEKGICKSCGARAAINLEWLPVAPELYEFCAAGETESAEAALEDAQAESYAYAEAAGEWKSRSTELERRLTELHHDSQAMLAESDARRDAAETRATELAEALRQTREWIEFKKRHAQERIEQTNNIGIPCIPSDSSLNAYLQGERDCAGTLLEQFDKAAASSTGAQP